MKEAQKERGPAGTDPQSAAIASSVAETTKKKVTSKEEIVNLLKGEPTYKQKLIVDGVYEGLKQRGVL